MIYDVIIVGAGPAGANAALEFAGSNINVLVIEKEVLPRDKPCGGLMPASIEKLIRIDISKIVKNRTKLQKNYHNYKDEIVRKTLGTSSPLLVNRSEFDMFLLDQALAIGVDNISVMDKSRVISVNERDEQVIITLENGSVLKTKYLIAADGALGKVASSIGLMQGRKFATSYDAEIIASCEYYDRHSDELIMNYYCLPYGYGWIFPKEKKRFSCGIGTWGKPLDLKTELRSFIKRSFPKNSIEKIEISGYPIPIYQGSQKIATDRILLTGDAASLTAPVSGEGIRFALHSGKIAADVIKQAFMQNEDKLTSSVSEKYQKIIEEKIGKKLKYNLSFAALAFHNSPDMFYRTFIKRESKK